MALFHPGQMLVYGNVGVCQVEAVGTPKFLRGESREYYTLTPVYSKHKEKIYLPTGTAAYLRPPVTPQQGAAYLAEMPALEVRTSRYLKQALLAQHYQELLQSHCVPDYLRLFKEISCKERQRKNSGKKLNLSPAQPNQSPAACGGVYHTYKSIPTPHTGPPPACGAFCIRTDCAQCPAML